MKKTAHNVNCNTSVLGVIKTYVEKKISGTRMFDQREVIDKQIISLVNHNIGEKVLRVVKTNTLNMSIITLRDAVSKLTSRRPLRRDGSIRRNMRF